MRKITLTIGVKSSDVEDVTSEKRIDISEILSLYPDVLANPSECRPIAILRYLKDQQGDLLIGSGIDKVTDYTILRRELHRRGEDISKVIVKFPAITVKSYKRSYEQHARWLDYSPEAAESIAREYLEQLHLLVETIKQDGIEVEVIN